MLSKLFGTNNDHLDHLWHIANIQLKDATKVNKVQVQ